MRHEAYMKQRRELEDMVNNPSHYNKAGIECIEASYRRWLRVLPSR